MNLNVNRKMQNGSVWPGHCLRHALELKSEISLALAEIAWNVPSPELNEQFYFFRYNDNILSAEFNWILDAFPPLTKGFLHTLQIQSLGLSQFNRLCYEQDSVACPALGTRMQFCSSIPMNSAKALLLHSCARAASC